MSQTKWIRVSVKTYELLKNLSEKEEATLQVILDKIAQQYYFEEVNRAFENMSDEDWINELKEREEMDYLQEDFVDEAN